MESFSTPRRAALPWIANVCTVAVLVSVAWWSNAHRPAPVAGEAALVSPAGAPAAGGLTPTATQPADAGNAAPASERAWPRQTTTAPREGLQTVSYGSGRH